MQTRRRRLAARTAVLGAAIALVACSGDPSPSPATAVTAASPSATRLVSPTAGRSATAPASATASPSATASASATAVEWPAEWEAIEPGGETVCARGDPFRFWVRRGDPSRLVFFMQGGGGCWSYESCRPGSNLFDGSVTEADHPERYDGIFDLAREDNPLRDWTFVVVPACGADAFWGDREATYSAGGASVTIQHRGFVNASAAADWAAENVPDPERVFVSGCSAGSAGSALLAPYLIEAYPDAAVEQLGDSLAFVFGSGVDLTEFGAQNVLPDWIPGLAAVELTSFQTADYYAAVANHYPAVTFAQLNSSADSVQRLFYEGLSGERGSFEADLRASLDAIHAEADNFRSCTLGGDEHCFVDRERFYTRAVEGVAIRDWVANLATGEDVPNLACEDCNAPETAP